MLNGNTVTNYGKDLSGLTALCDVLPALKNPISLELANCNLKVAEVNELARAMAAGGAVARLSLSGNMITGSEQVSERRRQFWKYDLDLSGLISLCDALLTLKNPIELDLSNCGLSVNGVNPVAKAISAGAALTEVNVAFNQIGSDGGIALRDALQTSNLKFLAIGKMYSCSVFTFTLAHHWWYRIVHVTSQCALK